MDLTTFVDVNTKKCLDDFWQCHNNYKEFVQTRYSYNDDYRCNDDVSQCVRTIVGSIGINITADVMKNTIRKVVDPCDIPKKEIDDLKKENAKASERLKFCLV